MNTCLINEKNLIHGVDERNALEILRHIYTCLDKQLNLFDSNAYSSLVKFRSYSKL